MKRPFLWIFIFYLLGIIFYRTFQTNIDLTLTLMLIAIISTLILYILRVRRYIRYIVLIIIFLIGIIATNHSVEKNMLPQFDEKEVKLEGIVKDTIAKEKGFEKYLVYVKKIKYKDKIYNINEKTILNIYSDTKIKVGDKILDEVKIKEPNRNTNPRLFNYKLHLQTKDIFSVGSSNGYSIKILSSKNISTLEKSSIRFREWVSLKLDESLNKRNSLIIKSIILGDDSFLDKEEVDKFRSLGLSHILAISGLHIGIIYGAIIFCFDVLKFNRKFSMVLSILIIWIYGYLVGYPPSVLRGSIMFSILIIASITYYRYDSLNILPLSGFIMLTYRPLWLFSIGFQLSFLATFTIILFTPKIKEIVKIKNMTIKNSISVIIAAQIGVLPIVIYYFNELQILSIVANLIVVPLLSSGLVLGFLILLTSMINTKVSLLIGILANIILNLSNFISDILHKFTYLNIIFYSPSFFEIIFYYFIVITLLKIIDITLISKKIQRVIYGYFIICLVFNTVSKSFYEDISVEFIDVGQGDSCLIRFNNKNILVDTGGSILSNFNIGENILLPYLQKTGVNSIDGIFLTHFHEDHAQGVLSLLGSMKVKNIFIGYTDYNSNLYRDIMKLSKQSNVPIKIIIEGNKLKINKDSYIEVLNPLNSEVGYTDDNNKSLTFILSIYNKKLLFTGDIEKESEARIINKHKSQSVDILKVPHHGSKTSSTEEFINHFSPRVAVIQVGRNNFGHPDESVLKRYRDSKTKILRNDKSGLITANITKEKISISSYITNKKSFTNFLMKNIYSICSYILYNGIIIRFILEYKKRRQYEL
ncbi:DNA internalization-like competence protein [Gottschalkia acidurici 9a]|uniref:DNA internalization-like competence protein n=1 Tax=Gottschalkia acidurici (strain ATCC 7906 / DSM 604 / BCRC 14475 / CIP 104303 / KCTC 5404 / NCIMB 10678 / 9a) TaxID=1128398 RepID=K0B2L2_GOTA9|nr:DNA internalization-related competence protein ComEC/Rec2 [Gottschalkia acidurici]AFS78846.1 DNA internalization-like competence protein [Gottschalkia acidurici 9a]